MSIRSPNRNRTRLLTHIHRAQTVAWAASLACASLAHAAAEPATATLREVVISASRQESLSDDVPATVDVLNRDSAERTLTQDIRDAVQDLPNVSVPRGPSRFAVTGVANNTGRDGNSGISIRGLGGNRVLMMEDGIRLPRSYVFGGNAFGRDTVSFDVLKRMEVLRGASSALYGSDGLAGLVNIITHEPADFLQRPGQAPAAVAGRISTAWSGDDHGRSLSGTLAGAFNEQSQWLVTWGARRAQGVQTMGTVNTPDSNRTAANPEEASDSVLMGKWVFTPNGTQKHTLTAEHVRKHADVNLLSSRTPLPLSGSASQIAGAIMDERGSNHSERNRLTWDARYQLQSPWADQVRTVLGVQHAQARQWGWSDRNTLSDRERDVQYNERGWQASVQATQTTDLGKGWGRTLTYGADTQRTTLTNLYGGINPLPPEVFPLKRFPDTRESNSALFAQAEWFSPTWSIVPGVRLDHFSLNVLTQDGFSPPASLPGRSMSGSAVSPKLGMLYRVASDLSLFGQAAGGFRAPNANQVNGYFENMAEHVVIVPNPDLKPEKSRTLELGVRGRWAPFTLDAAVFTGHYSNLIVDNVLQSGTGTAADPKLFQTVNSARARISGFEFKGRYQLGEVGGGRLSLPFTYGQARGTDTDTGKPLNSIEPAKTTVGMDWVNTHWSLAMVVRHHAAKRAEDIDSAGLVKAPKVQITTPAATTLDVNAQWRLSRSTRLNLALINLTDRTYWNWSDVRGLDTTTTVADAYTQPGRHLKVSLVVDF